MPSIARKNLFEDLPRFLVAQAGIMFAVSLVTIQTGIFQGVIRSTALLVDSSEADIWLASQNMAALELTLQIPYERFLQAQNVEGVERAEPLIVNGALWRDDQGQLNHVRIIGFDPDGELFIPGTITKGRVNELKEPFTIFVEEKNLDGLNVQWNGDEIELGAFQSKVVGFTKDTQSIISAPFVFASLENANLYVTTPLMEDSAQLIGTQPERLTSENSSKLPVGDPQKLSPEHLSQLSVDDLKKLTPEQLSKLSRADIQTLTPEQLSQLSVSGSQGLTSKDASGLFTATPKPLTSKDLITYVLIRAKPTEDLHSLKTRLEQTVPYTRAYTREEMAERTRTYWEKRTGIGFILGLGAVVGAIVGIVVVGQILYSSVSDHLKEFGTLKAIGASDWLIYGVIIEQALWMAVLGYIPGIAVCFGVKAWVLAAQGLVILITPTTAAGVFGITVLMCVSSALFAIQKVNRVDPAIVFKA